MTLEAVLLDAGGVLVNPNWARVGEALARHGVDVEPARLAAAEPLAKRELDTPERVRATNDQTRGWKYFNLVLTHAGIPLSPATDASLADLAEYHRVHNLWESVPEEVPRALAALKQMGLPLAVASNANGTVRAKLARLGLVDWFDLVIDSQELGVEKPDPAFFEFALDRLGVKA